MVDLHCSEPAQRVQDMKIECLFFIVSVVKADADDDCATDVRRLAEQTKGLFSDVERHEIIRDIKQAIITVHQAAIWKAPSIR
jgi:CRISPR/Cas system type I-B associated protein Csh2 (Cas7 group RAMP superfamily)